MTSFYNENRLQKSWIALIFIALFPTFAMAATDLAGEITYSRGEVTLYHDNKPATIQTHMPIYAGDTLLTGKRGRIKCKMVDQSFIYVSKGSRITIKSYTHDKQTLKNGEMNLLWGKSRFLVHKLTSNGAFNVKTSTAVMGVRGTEFVVMVPPPPTMPRGAKVTLASIPHMPTRLVLLHGIVAASNVRGTGISHMVHPGETSTFLPSGTVQTHPSRQSDLDTMPSSTPSIQTPAQKSQKGRGKKKENSTTPNPSQPSEPPLSSPSGSSQRTAHKTALLMQQSKRQSSQQGGGNIAQTAIQQKRSVTSKVLLKPTF